MFSLRTLISMTYPICQINQRAFLINFLFGVTLWDLCHVGNRIKNPFNSINHKRHLAICIVTTQMTKMISTILYHDPQAIIALCQFHVT